MLRNSKFKTFVWYSGVGLLLLIAVAVTLLRLTFSSIDEYRGQLEEVAGSYLGQPVTISGMDARLAGIAPTLTLSDVALLYKEGGQPLTRFSAISIALDPVASLRSGTPIIELTVSGANLEVTRKRDGSFAVRGLELAAASSTPQQDGQGVAEQGKALGSWFLRQSRLALRDSRLVLHNEKSGERFSFANVELELRNDGTRHRLNGFVHLPKGIGKELRVAADMEGDLLQRNGWSGGFYVRTAQLQSRQWLAQLVWQGSEIRKGVLDLELWSRWHNGRLAAVSTRLSAAGLVLARGKQLQTFSRLAADAQWLSEGDSWRLDVDDLQIQQDETPALPVKLALTGRGQDYSLQADQLPLAPLAALLPYLPQLDEQSRSLVRQMAPAGVVRSLRVSHSPEKPIEAQGRVKGLTLMPWEKLPGVSGLDAEFSFNGDHGRVQLQTENGELSLPRLFRAPLALRHLSGELALRREADGWQLLGSSIALENSDISAQLAVELRLTEGSAPWLSLQGRFHADDAAAVPRYLPAVIMKEKSLHWLDHAFLGGRVPAGSLQYHGYLKPFPFKSQQGRFEVLFDAEAVQLHYGDHWPDLQQLAGEVHFDGLSMQIEARGARVFGARLGPSSVSIDNFRAPRLLVDGRAKLPVADGLRFLRESPLSRHTGKMLETMQGAGDASLALKLAIPLSPKVGATLPLKVEGRVDFADDRLAIVEGVKLQQLNGTLLFTENSFTADQLTAGLFGKPVSLMVVSEEGGKSQVVVTARGGGELAAVREALKLPLLDYLQGELAWQASLTLPRGVSAEGVVLRINSDLRGVSSSLPAPLVKEAASSWDMNLALYLSGARSGESHLTLEDFLGLVWRQGGSDEERSLRRMQLRLGASAPLSLPTRDMIDVVGRGGAVSLAAWREVLRKLQGERRGTQQPLPIVVTMEQLQLLSDSGSDETGLAAEELRLADIPAITFAVEDLSYDDLPLGKVAVNIVPQAKQLMMKGIRLESETFTLEGEGSWQESGNTLFDLQLDSPELGAMMKQLGFATVIQGGETRASGKLWWSGPPTALSLAGLNGQLALSIKEGTIVDVEPGAGRLLGILSLPALPRRLFLDFSDVFKEGFTFELIKGDLRIEQGEAYTTNLQVKSVPANILLTGRTGLVAQDFDQELFVVPNVSDSVSVASALAWGPQVAVVVALLQEVFKSGIDEATMTRYHITGSWREPVIRRIEEQQEESDKPFFVE